MSITLTNARLATLWPRKLAEGHITVDHGRIMRISRDLRPGESEVIDCTGKLVIPGNVCAHTHLYSALARGMPGPPRTPTNFVEILQYVWWRLDRALDERSLRSSALVGVLDAIRAGTTTLVDHHSSPSYIEGSLDAVADAFDAAGLRGVLCYEVTDRNGRSGRDAGLRENDRFLRAARERVRGVVGAHASFTLEDDSLHDLAELARQHDTGVHIHVAEDAADEEDSLRRCRKRVVHRLDDAGVVQPRSILAHCVHLDDGELRLAQRRQSWMIHNCRSNMNNSVGRAPVGSFGMRCGLGTDGVDQDMFAESRTAFFRGREEGLEASADEYGNMLAHGAALVSEVFGFPAGTLEAGAIADLVVLDYDPPTPLTEGNLAWHWMFALSAGHVESVMVDGRWVMRDRVVLGVDEEKIRAEAREEAVRLWTAMESL